MTDTPRTGYAVTDWDSLFETDDKGGAWRDGKPFRRGPLNYLRLPCVGTFRRRLDMIRTVAGTDAPVVKGLFVDLLALVGGMDRDQREGGLIRGVDGEPAGPAEIADTISVDHDTVGRAIAVLTDRRVGLLKVVAVEEPSPIPRDSGEIPGNPRKSGAEPGAIQNNAIQSIARQNKAIPEREQEQAAFERFWSAYPKKTGHKDAQVAFMKIAPDASLVERILTAVQRWSTSGDWLRDGGRYIPRPAKWLESEGWTDEIPAQTTGFDHDCLKCRPDGIRGTGRHRHDHSESGPYWFCDAHEAQSRKVSENVRT